MLHQLRLGFPDPPLNLAMQSPPSNCSQIDPSLILNFGGKVGYGDLRIARLELGLGMDWGKFSGIGEWDWGNF